ncbi:peptidoglycan-binding protein [Geobacillus genomosp. 3]|uniref:Peptidoglycan-binding protein n=1 Tax=Geobacillus genomosp. 3 TaxID=1921421 RepID=S5Z6R2_GEOG3|nr:LysM peptidoglycan-binding domain-containing protein [Geobacillus genomosp. 3]AGT32562.1 peptidoglycan-binding protein [Geobacillus genomosp. 3]
MEGTPRRLARKKRPTSDADASPSRLNRRRQKEEQKRKYIPARLLALLFLALPAAVLAIHHARSESGTVTVVRHEETSSRETVRVIRADDVEAAGQMPKRERPAGEKNVGEADSKTITHIVAPNETLYSIAMKYYGTPSAMDIIKKENGLSTNRLEPGQMLRIPLHEEN